MDKNATEAIKGKGQSKKGQMDALLRLASSAKPDGYDKHHADLSDLYHGHQEELTKIEMMRRFPKTWDKMPIETVGIVRRVAQEDATAYTQPPERWIEVGGLYPKASDEPGKGETSDPKAVEKQTQFQDVVERARVHQVLREAERRLMVSEVVFLRMGWRDKVYGQQSSFDDVVTLHPYWPHQVNVVCHHSDPSNMDRAYLLVATVMGAGGEKWFEVWRREYMEEDGKLVGFGEWIAEMWPAYKDEKDLREPYLLYGDGQYPLRLPWLVMRDGIATHGVYLDGGRDLVGTQLNLNAMYSDHYYTVDIHGHPRLYASSDKLVQNPASIKFGPGNFLAVPTGDSVGAIASDVTDVIMRTASERLRALAVQRSQPSHRYDTEQNTVLSGVARKVEDIPSNRARTERIEQYRDFEESVLLPAMVEIADYWGEYTIAHDKAGNLDESITYHVRFEDLPEYESEQVKEQYAAALLDRSAISKAHYAVLAGAYRNIKEAQDAGLSAEITEQPGGGTGGTPGLAAFAERLREEPDTGDTEEAAGEGGEA